jgi:hypothetical protein
MIEGNEFKHIECPQSWINAELDAYSLFFWDLVGTQTILSRESHLERSFFAPDTLYSVTTTERFGSIDFRRKRHIPYIDNIKEIEKKYFAIRNRLIALGSNPLNGFGPPPKKQAGCMAYLLCFVLIGFFLLQQTKSRNEKILLEYQQTKAEFDKLISDNKAILNI